MSRFANFQYVTLVAAGGTPIRICNRDGAPFPTTGHGALVFSDGATLTNVHIDGIVIPSPLGLTNGTQAAPSVYWGTTDKGIYSQGSGNLTIVSQNQKLLSVSPNIFQFYANTFNARLDIYTVTSTAMAMQVFNQAAPLYAPLLLQPSGSVVRVGSSVAAVSGGSVSDAAIALTNGLQSLSVTSGAPTVPASRGSIAMRDDVPGAGLPYFNEGGTTWQQLVGVSATQTLTNKTIQFANGSAAAPSVTFTSNTATGIYLNSSNVLGAASNGSAAALFTRYLADINAATTAQASANCLLVAPPSTDGFTSGNSYVPVDGAKTRVGLNSGHIAIGPTNIHAFVSLHIDETYVNSEQEMRGVNSLIRYYRTTADEPTLGWDIFGGMSGLQVTAANTQYIRGNMKGHASEIYFSSPSVGSYSARISYNYQAYVEVGANATLEYWTGFIVSSPSGAGTINEGYGIDILAISMPTTKGAIRLRGSGDAGRIVWPASYVTQEASGVWSVVASAVCLAGLAGSESARVVTVASAVNRIELYGAATTDNVAFRAAGSDSNVGILYQTKGTTGTHVFQTNTNVTQFQIRHLDAAVNWLNARGGITANPAVLFADGETNVGISYQTKGTGTHLFQTNTSTTQVLIGHVASAVNRWELYGSATGNAVIVRAAGSDTNIGATFQTTGTGVYTFQTNLGTTQFQVRHIASAANWLNARGGTTGNPAEFFADGSDADVDILLSPKGAGVLRFGTRTAIGAETVTGYITVKDSGGTTRKLAVVS